jgi:hypothetical protein
MARSWSPRIVVLPFAALLLVCGAKPAPAQVTGDELLCEVKASVLAWKLFYQHGKCLLACNRNVRAGELDAAACDPGPELDARTAACLQKTSSSMTGSACKSCAGNVPACYGAGNCPDVVQDVLGSVAAEAVGVTDAVLCDDTASGDGLTAVEAKCEDGLALLLGKFAARKAMCLARCRKRFTGNECMGGAVTEPNTAECIAKAENRTITSIARRCPDPPECHGSTDAAGWVASVEQLVDGHDADLFCASPSGAFVQ